MKTIKNQEEMKMKELLILAAKGTKYEGNENELYITICGDVRKQHLSREQSVKKIAKIIFDMAMCKCN